MTSVIMIAPLNAANFETGNASAGDVLTADGAGGAAMAAPAGGVPSTDGASDGDVVTLSTGTVVWQAPAGGGGDDDWVVHPLGGRYTPGNTAAGKDAFAVGLSNSASGYQSTVGGGRYNSASGIQSTVGGGGQNTASGYQSTVGGGNYNSASGGYQSTVSGGVGNSASGYYATIGGGKDNFASGSGATVGGGKMNNASGINATISGGYNALADRYGQSAQAAGKFATRGDAQTSVLVARRSTTNATPAELFLDGSGARCTIKTNTTLAFDILVVARSSSALNESAAYHFRGCADNNGGVTALVGTVVKTIVAEDTAAWDCDVTADSTNDTLVITATGEAGKTIQWVARIELVETTG